VEGAWSRPRRARAVEVDRCHRVQERIEQAHPFLRSRQQLSCGQLSPLHQLRLRGGIQPGNLARSH
jgi:hypothetical protein